MPILPSEPALYPEELFADVPVLPGADQTWWVLHTRPRQEKSLARELRQLHLSFYLPLIARRCHVRGRVMQSHIPLFPSYLFLRGGDQDRLTALNTHRVVRSIAVSAQDELWRDLRQVHTLIGSGAPITPEDRLEPGMLVEIRSGPLAGLRGKIIRSATGRRFVISVNFIQQGASVTIEDFALAPIETL